MTEHKSTLHDMPIADNNHAEIRRLAILFGAVYLAEGICQVVLLLQQPLNNYLRKSLFYSTDQIAAFKYFVMMPWMIKPVYGLLSDFVPILGYRRKTYLLGMNLLAAGAFCWAWGLTSPGVLRTALLLTALGVACSDVVIDGLMVESGQRTGRVKLFQGVQWTCISVATIASAYIGGQLTEHMSPPAALRAALVICASVAGSIAILSWILVREPKSRLNLAQLRLTSRGVAMAFRSWKLWLVLAFLMLAHFNPGMETPLYIHQTESLKFSEADYGKLNAITAIGYATGALLFTVVIAPRFSTRGSIVIGLSAISVGALMYLFMRDLPTARIASFAYGVGYMLSAVSLLSLAAEACPKRAEGFTFAAMMSVMNIAMQGADYIGSVLYERVTHKQFWPLPLISAGVTLIAIPLLALLPKQVSPDAPAELAIAR
jgi:predicted MFS family arabinose efflux permease